MTSTNWKSLRDSLDLSPEDEEIINLEKNLIKTIVEAREQKGLTQKQLSDICGIKQPVISRLESAVHSAQINSIIRILKPLGYTLSIVKEDT